MANSASLLQSLVGPQKPKDLFTSLLLKGALDSSPVQHWSQGAARMAQALLGGAMMRDDDRESEAALQTRMNAPGLAPVLAQSEPQPAITSGPRPANAPPLTVGNQEPRGIRNNNPGNIEAGAFAASQPGFQGSDGRFARFQTPQQGMDAAGNLLNIYGQKHGINTVAGVVNRWAPASDGNPVSAYASHVAQAMGVGPNDPINLSDPAVRQKLAQAMAHFENGRPVQMAQAGGPPRSPVQIPPEVAAHIQRLYATRNPANIQQADALYQQYAKPAEYNFQTVGDRLYRTTKTGQYEEVADATRATDEERNLAAENRSRQQRGQPPLSMIEFRQAKEAADKSGQLQGEARTNLDMIVGRAQDALKTIDQLRNHPGKQYAIGSLGVVPGIPGTSQRGFIAMLNQAKGQTFLEAYNLLRGGGQITEVEGVKAEQAMGRLDRAQSPDDFEAALKDLESVVRSGIDRAKLKASGESRVAAPAPTADNDPLGIRR